MQKEVLVYDLVSNGLLCLYLTMSNISVYVPAHKRREILTAYYKRMLNEPKYGSVRQDVRGFLKACRHPHRNIDEVLFELYQSAQKVNGELRYDEC
ncbi:hypothetical protein B9J88_15600 [Vibrio sp. V05_P4A8T149]|nr:hypothetical protein B9J88_15600 [Vibrio sp. V05_P4A8T149]OXX31287.1 hypothetical protein B9J95_09465 [Vibrio sp. V14_P6S14T42]OXX39114.1 hypothetical protein B9J81_00405 [Vibrio sp. V04_P4A5T148]OXX51499.1 hypothetical protein B9J91_17005 [Vibrio sp. V18_P1S4T112]